MKHYTLKKYRYLDTSSLEVFNEVSKFIQTAMRAGISDEDYLQALYFLLNTSGFIYDRIFKYAGTFPDSGVDDELDSLFDSKTFDYFAHETTLAAEDLLKYLIADARENFGFVLNAEKQKLELIKISYRKTGQLHLPVSNTQKLSEDFIKSLINPLYECLLEIHYMNKHRISLIYHDGFHPATYTVIEQGRARRHYLRVTPKYFSYPGHLETTFILEGNSTVTKMICDAINVFENNRECNTSDVFKEKEALFMEIYQQFKSLQLTDEYREITDCNLTIALNKCSRLVYHPYLSNPVKFTK
jgi:hypothetical protein